MLLVVVALVVRFAPAKQRPWHWVSFGAGISVGGWGLMTFAFWWYLTNVADYGTMFGNLATIVVVLEYLYLSVIVFLSGILVDSLTRAQVGEDQKGAAT